MQKMVETCMRRDSLMGQLTACKKRWKIHGRYSIYLIREALHNSISWSKAFLIERQNDNSNDADNNTDK